jgi:class 3 adenylate cyclase
MIGNSIYSTAVLTDIRSFSETFKQFQSEDSDTFLLFLEHYFSSQKDIANIISDKYYQNSTGDGVLSVFMGDKSYLDAYAYVLANNHYLRKMFDKFNSQWDTKLDFGIGADSGDVWNIGESNLNTYVGTVINRSARLESKTKDFAKTTTAIGNSLYKKLIEKFNPTAYEIMEKYNDYDSLIHENPEVVFISRKFLLRYVNDIPLKGIQDNAPYFTISRALEKQPNIYQTIFNKLLDADRYDKLVKYLDI